MPRKIHVLRCGKWVEKEMMELKDGDKFKMFEEDGSEVLTPEGESIMTVSGEPYEVDLVWAVDLKEPQTESSK